MELKPLGRWTVKIATNSTAAIGTIARGWERKRRNTEPAK
jgi:hypothetical protein